MSLNGSISSLGAIELRLTRTQHGTRANGRYTAGTKATSTIAAGVQPLTGRQLMDVPEGRRGDEILMLYTDTALYTESPGTDPDVVAYMGSDPDTIAMMGAGEPWTVIRVKTWQGLGETHREVQIARAPSPAGAVP